MMTEAEAVGLIEKALERALKRQVAFDVGTDFIAAEILDSLDGIVFAMELEALAGKAFPEDADLVDEGYFRVPKLIEFLTSGDNRVENPRSPRPG